jgi:hypothetical protein
MRMSLRRGAAVHVDLFNRDGFTHRACHHRLGSPIHFETSLGRLCLTTCSHLLTKVSVSRARHVQSLKINPLLMRVPQVVVMRRQSRLAAAKYGPGECSPFQRFTRVGSVVRTPARISHLRRAPSGGTSLAAAQRCCADSMCERHPRRRCACSRCRYGLGRRGCAVHLFGVQDATSCKTAAPHPDTLRAAAA